MITLRLLSAILGDAKMHFEDEGPENRKKLWELVDQWLKSGHVVFLIEEENKLSRRVYGYDPDANEWIVGFNAVPALKPEVPDVPAPKRRKYPRISAGETRVVGIAHTAGG